MAKKNDMRAAAHTHAIRKLQELHRVEKTCDEPSKQFILAQKLFVAAEEQLVFAAANAIAMGVSSRHLGMALSQALIEPIAIMGSVIHQHRGEDQYSELLTSFFGRTLQLARDEYGFTHLSADPLWEGEV